MDCVKLVNDGAYSKDDLSYRNRAFIEGMEYVRDNVLTKDFIAEDDIDGTFSQTFVKITKEISDNIIMTLNDFTHMVICDTIVSFAEGRDTDGNILPVADDISSSGEKDECRNVQQVFKKTSQGLEIVPEAAFYMRYHDLREIVDFVKKFKTEDLPAGIKEHLAEWEEFLVDNY